MIKSPADGELAGLGPSELLDRLSVPSQLGVRPGLEKIRRLLSELGDPQRGLPVLHVGGTSGKGSTSTIAARILREAGYRVGLHVKPHLESVEERFVVDDRAISSELLAERLRALAPAALAIGPTWYELTVALALDHFRRSAVDLAVVEVGLGGTYDGTNVVEPLVATLTNVGLDHTEVLGDTVEKIAADKAGILKAGALAVSGVVQPSAAEIVVERCRANGVPLWQLGPEVRYRVRELTPQGSRFDVSAPGIELNDLTLSLLGEHQIANATIALASILRLGERGYRVPEAAIRRGLERARVSGRIEIVGRDPLVVLDGAHNPDKMGALASAMEHLFPSRRVIGVLAFKRGHDVGTTLRRISPQLDEVILTSFEAETDFGRGQAIPPAELAELYRAAGGRAGRVEADPVRALAQALDAASPGDLVCVTGSLYLVGVIRTALRRRGELSE